MDFSYVKALRGLSNMMFFSDKIKQNLNHQFSLAKTVMTSLKEVRWEITVEETIKIS